MKTSTYWIIWSLVLIIINIGAFPIALFSLFGTAAGTSIFSVDYLIAFCIILLANIISIQLFIVSRKQDQKGFLYGLIIAILEVCSMLFLINNTFDLLICVILVAISIVGAVILLIRSIVVKQVKVSNVK